MKPGNYVSVFLEWGLQAERLEKEQEEEKVFRKTMLDKLAEEDRVEQMNAMKRRIKVAEHLREVERLVEQKRAMYAAARVSSLRGCEHAVNVYCRPTCRSWDPTTLTFRQDCIGLHQVVLCTTYMCWSCA